MFRSGFQRWIVLAALVIAPATVRESASKGSEVITVLEAGMQVTLIESAEGWVLVASDGKKLGYVEEKTLLRLQ